MFKTYLHIALIGLLSTLNFTLSTTRCFAEVPRLTVVVVANGLTEEHIPQLRPYWLQGGLQAFQSEMFFSTVNFNQTLYGGDEALVTLLTGTTPRTSGYAMDTIFDRVLRKPIAVIEDKTQDGIGTPLRLSLQGVRTATVGDELRLDYGKNSKIYAIGVHPITTMIMAGHTANACCWWDNITEQWVSTTYYPEGLPTAAFDWNNSDKKNKQTLNESITSVALEIQRTQQMGLDNVPDMLFIEYDLSQEDTNLDVLMNQLILRVGRHNLQLFVLGTPVPAQPSSFNIDRAAALTSTYLIALYGTERWVNGGWKNSIYLNQSLMEQKRISLPQIKAQVCTFLMDFEGVAAAYPVEDAMVLPETKENINKHCAGDVIVCLEHDWLYREPQATLLWWREDKTYPTHPINALDVKHLIYK